MPPSALRARRRRFRRVALLVPLLLAPSAPPVPGAGGGELYEAARQELSGGRPEAALELLDRALAASPEAAGQWDLRGWVLLRLGRPAEAARSFGRALGLEPAAISPHAGIGYARLHLGDPDGALLRFERVLAAEPGHGDAARGRVRALLRLGRLDEAEEALAPLRAATPGEAELAELAARLAAAIPAREARPRGPVPPGAPLRVPARAGPRYLEVPDGSGWRPLFVKGVNLGVALPGRFPSQFPADEAVYRGWLASIAGMNANAVRLYTLLPPAFYRALRAHNRASKGAALWLIQGAWVEPPPGDDFEDEGFRSAFAAEIARVLDALHGNLDLPARPGHAAGRYRADVSGWTLALILGREWEPFTVVAHDALHPGRHAYRGRFAHLEDGSAMEAWLAWVLDTAVAHETDHYRVQRPVAFSNWPTLDPLHHPTESSRAEENAMRRARGEEVRERKVPQYNDDEVTVDAERIVPAGENRAGFFASYHVYPYHPDFMILDPALREAQSSRGPSSHFGYLRELKAHHGSQPLLIAELGVPTSRGIAHLHPQGWHHGGQSERQQGERDARMMHDLHEAGAAGGMLFAWLDEWFKRTWITAPLEIPAERDPLWHNLMDPEESFGLLAARAGPESGGHRLDGDPGEWEEMEGVLRERYGEPDAGGGCAAPGRLLSAAASADAAWLHVMLTVEGAGCGGAFDWGEVGVLIGIDTHDPEGGDRRLLPGDDRLLSSGVEFRVRLRGSGRSDIQVDPPYDVGSNLPEGPFVPLPGDDGRYLVISRETNRRRIGRDGTEFPSIHSDQSRLRFLSEAPGSPERADVAVSAHGATGVVELRLPWALLNFTDPSSHRVLHQPARHPAPFEAVPTDGVRFHLSTRGPGDEERDAAVLGPFLWPGWERPVFHLTRKASYRLVQDAFGSLPDHPGEGGR